ncbi:phage tail sheath family protein [Streptomyces orinoci]|uniref:Phage tail sheath C-terminal domain-containing protein n=1 Tax=Streptomyces orinoci TaxID=67339 RepID=A0ABV3K0G6_STRON|nr:phage tail sheath C-terminal domain-containing protein [Streptomyces orinoci]
MTTPQAPGVQVREIPSGVRLITGVSTSVAAFIGLTFTGPAGPGTPEKVWNWAEFTEKFEYRFDELCALAAQLRTTAERADRLAKEMTKLAANDEKAAQLEQDEKIKYEALEKDKQYWEQEYVSLKTKVSAVFAKETGKYTNTRDKEYETQAGAFRPKPDPALATLRADLAALDAVVRKYQLMRQAVRCYFDNGGGPCYVANIDAADSKGVAGAFEDALTALVDIREVSIVAAPDLWTITDDGTAQTPAARIQKYRGLQSKMAGHCHTMRNRMAILDAPPDIQPTQVKEQYFDATPGFTTEARPYAALYYPWLHVPVSGPSPLLVPPCGHVAGVWARVDDERGVHKAPANEALVTVAAPQYPVTDGLQKLLNPLGINCIRQFPQRGILIWGARTLTEETDADWRYVNVRRLVSFIDESILQGTQWAVFEPNDERLWTAIRRNVSAFLTDLWRQGALQGATADQAFYVKCDEANNLKPSVLAGNVICDVGIAPVRPAEFVHFQVTQLAGRNAG